MTYQRAALSAPWENMRFRRPKPNYKTFGKSSIKYFGIFWRFQMPMKHEKSFKSGIFFSFALAIQWSFRYFACLIKFNYRRWLEEAAILVNIWRPFLPTKHPKCAHNALRWRPNAFQASVLFENEATSHAKASFHQWKMYAPSNLLICNLNNLCNFCTFHAPLCLTFVEVVSELLVREDMNKQFSSRF